MRYFILFLLFLLSTELEAQDLRERLASLYNQGKYEEAVILCEKEIEVSPNKFYYLNLALINEELGDISSSLSVLEEAFSQYKRDKDVIFHLGRVYLISSSYRESISLFKRYLKFEPQDRRAYFYLGLSYEYLGEVKQAERYYKKSLKIDPYFVLPLLRISDLYLAQGKYKEAEVVLKKIKEIEPSINSVYKKLALLYFRQGRFLLSFKEASKFLEMKPSDKEAQSVLKLSKKKLGEEFFRKEAQKLALARKKKKAKVTSFVRGKIPQVRVCIAKNISKFEFKVTEEALLYSKGLAVFKLDKNTLYKISLTSQGLVRLLDDKGRLISGRLRVPLTIKGASPTFLIGVFGLRYAHGRYWAKSLDSFFRGSLTINIKGKSLYLVNFLNLEEYLYGVLPSEVSSNWPKEALCAQAIVARTKALRVVLRRGEREYDFSNTYSFQVYLGASKETKATNEAVDRTRGLILVDEKDSPLQVYYSSNCGGHTQGIGKSHGVLDANRSIKKFPLTPLELYEWVTGEPPVFCKVEGALKSRFRWQRFYSKQEFFKMLEKASGLREVDKFEILERSFSSHVSKIKIIGKNTERVVSSELRVRRALDDLRSGLFWKEFIYSEKGPSYLIIWGGGFGHGRGLCQFGAKGMAQEGYSYEDILKHYFPSAYLKKLY